MQFPATMRVTAAERPLRIAIAYSRNVLPMNFADQMTVAHLVAFLSARGHAVDLYTIDAGGHPDAEQQAWLQDACREVHSYPHGKGTFVKAGLSAVPRWLPFQVALFDNRRMRSDIAARAADYDVIYTYYIRSGQATRALAKAKGLTTFIAYQLSQALNTRRIAENPRNWRYGAFYSLEHRLVRAYEARLWQDYTRAVLIGPADVEAVEQCCRAEGQPLIDNYVYGAHGTDLDRFAPKEGVTPVPGRIVFSGVMRTPTNIQAVQWFARNVWPIVKRERPHASWHIVGRQPAAEIEALGSLEGVTVTGAVPDPAVNIAEAEICVNPMQAGGGMQNKLIEFLASARATVATTVANEGICAIPGEHLVVADEPDAFAAAILNLLDDPVERERLARAGREFVQANWTWEAHWLKLEKDFYDAIDGKPASRVRSPAEALAAAAIEAA